jgi:hypothetical protein
MKRIILFLTYTVLFIGFSRINGQQLSIYANSLNGIVAENNFEGGSRGISLGINYLHPLNQNLKWLAGTEFNSISWGNNIVANIGLNYSRPIANKWSWSATLIIQQGIALFKPTAFYTWGLSSATGIEYSVSSKSTIFLGTGLKYYNCPAYKSYSLISHYLDFPIELAYRIKLK